MSVENVSQIRRCPRKVFQLYLQCLFCVFTNALVGKGRTIADVEKHSRKSNSIEFKVDHLHQKMNFRGKSISEKIIMIKMIIVMAIVVEH